MTRQTCKHCGRKDDSYNGWTNRETWACHLHLTNDEGWYDMARGIVADAGGTRDGYAAANALADWFDEIGGYTPTPGIRMMLDDIGSLWRVNWREVANALRDE